MRNNLTVFIIYSIFLSFNSFGQELKLTILSSSRTFVKGEKIQLKLSIEKINSDSIFPSSKFEISSYNKFVYDFEITARDTGKLTLGPYTLNFNSKTLVSNSIEVNIKNGTLDENQIVIKCPLNVTSNEKVTLELVNFKTPLNDISLKKNPDIKIGSTSSSSDMVFEDKKSKYQYNLTIELTFTKPGIYKINDSWFEKVPATYTVTEKEIVVK